MTPRLLTCGFARLTLAAIASFAAGSACAAGRPGDRPNILWISCEDISPNLGCYGDRYAVTPNLDRLAAQGVRFTQAFGITGVCAPNRSCLITGVYPCSLGSHDMRCSIRLPDAIKCFPEYLRAAGYYCTNNVKTDYNFPVPKTAWDECSRKAHWRRRPAGKPFFSVFNLEVSHESQIRVHDAQFFRNTARLAPGQRHDPAKAPVPPFHPDLPEVRRDWARYYDNITAVDYQAADLLAELESAGLADDTIVFFFGDNGAGMPGCKKWVWESGLHVPLVIRFPKRYQRWAPAAPGGTCNRLVSFVDFAPTVLSLAGVKAPPHVQGVAFLGDLAGPPRQYIYAMRDRMAERFDTVRVVRDKEFQYVRNFMPQLPWSQFVSYTEEMPTMKAWRREAEAGRLSGAPARYFSPGKPVEELYDTVGDPHQLHNLAGDPRHGDTLRRMRAECVRWMREVYDLGLLPEYERECRAKDSTPYEIARSGRLHPLDRLLDAADLANRRDAVCLPDLVKLLKSDDAAVRWWGAVGLSALDGKASPAVDGLRHALADPSPEVRIAAAEALAGLGRTHEAESALLAAREHPSPVVRLRFLNALDRLELKTPVVLKAIESAKMEARGEVADYVNRMVEYLPGRLGRD